MCQILWGGTSPRRKYKCILLLLSLADWHNFHCYVIGQWHIQLCSQYISLCLWQQTSKVTASVVMWYIQSACIQALTTSPVDPHIAARQTTLLLDKLFWQLPFQTSQSGMRTAGRLNIVTMNNYIIQSTPTGCNTYLLYTSSSRRLERSVHVSSYEWMSWICS